MYKWLCKKELGADTPKLIFNRGGWNPPPRGSHDKNLPWEIGLSAELPIGLVLFMCFEVINVTGLTVKGYLPITYRFCLYALKCLLCRNIYQFPVSLKNLLGSLYFAGLSANSQLICYICYMLIEVFAGLTANFQSIYPMCFVGSTAKPQSI